MATTVMAELAGGALVTSWSSCGEKMAAGFDDGSVEVWHRDAAMELVFRWKAHAGSIAKLAWGPQEYGDVLASASTADAQVIVWEETSSGTGNVKWEQCARISDNAYSYALDLQFGNPPSGLKLVIACADGNARVFEALSSVGLARWQLQAQFPNVMEVNVSKTGRASCSAAAVSWRPPTGPVQQPLFALGYTSQSSKFSTVKIWEFADAHHRWYPVCELGAADEVGVTSVSWAPNIGRPHELVAIAAGASAFIWHLQLSSGEKETSAIKVAELDHPQQVLEVDWDMSGTTLATAAADGVVRLWQAGLDGAWRQQDALKGLNSI